MFDMTAASFAQFEAIHNLLHEAESTGQTVSGVVLANLYLDSNEGHTVRASVVLDDVPQTGTEWDRTYDFETGEEIARGEASVELAVGVLTDSLADLLGPTDIPLAA